MSAVFGGAGLAETLAETLVAGNTSGATDVVMSAGQALRGVDSTSGLSLQVRGGNGSAGGGGGVTITGGASANALGGGVTLIGGVSGGAAANSSVILVSGDGGGGAVGLVRVQSGASSTIDRAIFCGRVVLTDAAATTVATIALASGARCGGELSYSIDVTNGTDHQVLSGRINYSAVDKAGTLTQNVDNTLAQASLAASAGTLTASWAILDGVNSISLQVTADSSLTPTSMILYYRLDVFGAATTVT